MLYTSKYLCNKYKIKYFELNYWVQTGKVKIADMTSSHQRVFNTESEKQIEAILEERETKKKEKEDKEE